MPVSTKSNVLEMKSTIHEVQKTAQEIDNHLKTTLDNLGVSSIDLYEKAVQKAQGFSPTYSKYHQKEPTIFRKQKDDLLSDNREDALVALDKEIALMNRMRELMVSGTLQECLALIYANRKAYSFTPFIQYVNYLILESKEEFLENNPLKYLEMFITIDMSNRLPNLHIHSKEYLVSIPPTLKFLQLGFRSETVDFNAKHLPKEAINYHHQMSDSKDALDIYIRKLKATFSEKESLKKRRWIKAEHKSKKLKGLEDDIENTLSNLSYRYARFLVLKEAIDIQHDIDYLTVLNDVDSDVKLIQKYLKDVLDFDLEVKMSN